MVVVNVSDTPPTVSVVLVTVLLVAALVWRTHTDSPSLTLPGVAMNTPVQPTEKSPPDTVTVAAVLMPAMTIGAEITCVASATSD